MRIIIILVLYNWLSVNAQVNELYQDQNISGIITTNEGVYLVVEKGLIQIRETDIYQEYYRKMYNDSTLINPNTELKLNFTPNIIPFISSAEIQNKFELREDLNIGMFLQFNESNNVSLTSFGQIYIDSLLNND